MAGSLRRNKKRVEYLKILNIEIPILFRKNCNIKKLFSLDIKINFISDYEKSISHYKNNF